MSTATDVVRARDELYTYLAADRRAPGDPGAFGIKRMRAALNIAGVGNVGAAAVGDPTAATAATEETMLTCMTAGLISAVTDTRPEHTAVNYWVAPELHESITEIADALPDDTVHDQAPPPSPRGFALLGTPWRWTDPWGHELTAEAVSWGEGVLPLGDFGPADERARNGDAYLHPTWVALWTRLDSSHSRYVENALQGDRTALYALRGQHRWFLSRVSSMFWTSEVPDGVSTTFEVGPPRYALTDDERAAYTADGETLPLAGDGSNANVGRWVHALMLVLAGAQHVPGSTRDPAPAVALPNRTRTKFARRHGGSPLVSMIYAGVERPPTPRGNVGTRGPIGVRYWRAEHTRRRRGPDGTVRIVKVRGAWCGDEDAPESPYTKVRIAAGTVARPADVRPAERPQGPESEAS